MFQERFWDIAGVDVGFILKILHILFRFKVKVQDQGYHL
jgi:hypothetical protein